MLLPDPSVPHRSDTPTLLQWSGAPSEMQASGPAFAARTRAIADEMSRLHPRTLIDIGCGRGHVTAIAARHAYSIHATDLAPAAVEETRARLAFHPRANVACADAFSGEWPGCPDPPSAFDMALLSEVLEHVPDDVGMLRKIHGLLNDGGHLLMTVPAHMTLWTRWDDVAGHLRRYERRDLIRKLGVAGFTVVRLRTWGFPLSGWLAIRGSRYRGNRVRSSAPEVPSTLVRLMPLLTPGFRFLARVETIFARSDRGAGYVVLARKV